jgi:hypothetical protein
MPASLSNSAVSVAKYEPAVAFVELADSSFMIKVPVQLCPKHDKKGDLDKDQVGSLFDGIIPYEARMMFLIRNLPLTMAGRGVIAMLAASLAFVACAPNESSGSEEAEYHISSLRPSAQVSARREQDQGIFEVYSDNGIGSATVRLVSGEWPEAILLRFHLQGLEGLHFTYDETIINVSVTTQNIILQNATRNGLEKAIEEDSRMWMAIRFLERSGTTVNTPISGGVIEVQAPADFLNGDFEEFTIKWIDFYR